MSAPNGNTAMSDIMTAPIRPRFARPTGKIPKIDLNEKDNLYSVVRNTQNAEVTVASSSSISCTFGSAEFTIVVEALGDASKPLVIGFVPRDFTAFDAHMGQNGGCGMDSTGKLFGFDAGNEQKPPALDKGDAVTVRIDCTTDTLAMISVKSAAGKAKGEPVIVSFDPRACKGVVLPAVTLASANASVYLERLVDITSLDAFGKRLTTAPAGKAAKGISGTAVEYQADSFGSFWMRLFMRMIKETDTVKTSPPLSRGEVQARMLMSGVDSSAFTDDAGLERQRLLYMKATADLFADPGKNVKHVRDLCRNPAALFVGAGVMNGSISPVAMFAAALVSYVDREQETTIKQIQQQLASLAARGGGGGGGGGGDDGVGGSGEDFHLPPIGRKQPVAAPPSGPNSAGARPAPKPAPKPAPPPGGKAPAPKVVMPPVKSAAPAGKAAPAPAAKGGGGAAAGGSIAAVVKTLLKREDEIRTLGEKGSPSDEDLRNLEKAKVAYSKEKLAAAKQIQTMGDAALRVSNDSDKDEVIRLVSALVAGGDFTEGNAPLVKSIVEKVDIGWPDVINDQAFAVTAANDGCADYLETFLNVPDIELDTVEVMSSAMWGQTKRIPTTLMMLKYESVLNLSTYADDLEDVWNDFFATICSDAKPNAKEVRTGRIDLIKKMLAMQSMPLKVDYIGEDGQTPLMRAAKEGDMEVLKLLLADSRCNVNAVSEGGPKMSALIMATLGNKVEAVKFLLTQKGIDPSHMSSEGTALFLARSMHRDPNIVKALESFSGK
jgi:hypothetical protein